MSEECVICNGKYPLSVVANTCTNEPVCIKHIEEITRILLKRQKELKKGDEE